EPAIALGRVTDERRRDNLPAARSHVHVEQIRGLAKPWLMQAPEELAHLAPRASRREIPPYLDTVVFASGHGHSVAQPPPPANHPPAHAAPGSRPAPSSPPGPALTPGRPGLLVDPVQ